MSDHRSWDEKKALALAMLAKQRKLDEERRQRLLELYQDIAKRFGMSLIDVDRVTRAIVLMELDPIMAEGEPFMFKSQEARQPIGDGPYYIFWTLNERVPRPDDNVDLKVALKEFKRDCGVINDLLEFHAAELSFEMVARIHVQSLQWMEFWSRRHPDAERRAAYAAVIERAEPETARVNAIVADRKRRAQ